MGRNLGLEELTLIGLNVGSALKQSFLQMRTLEASFVVVIGGGFPTDSGSGKGSWYWPHQYLMPEK